MSPRLPSPQLLADYPPPADLSQSTARRAGGSSELGGKSTDDLLSVVRGAVRVPSPSPSILSTDDSNNIRFSRDPDFAPASDGHQYVHSVPSGFKGRMQLVWVRNKGLFLVLIAQFFGALMNVTTRLLEMEGNNGKERHCCCHGTVLTTCSRQRLPSLSRSVRSHGHNRSVCIAVHVVYRDGALSPWNEASPPDPSSSRSIRLLWNLWHVL